MNNTDEHRISSNEGMRCFFTEVHMESKQQIVITDKNKLEIDMVSYVRAFDEDGVLLDTVLGRISVEGKDLKIENFEKASTKILISGNICGVYYLEKRDKKQGRGAIR